MFTLQANYGIIHFDRVYKKVNENRILRGLIERLRFINQNVYIVLLKNEYQSIQSTQRGFISLININYLLTSKTPNKQHSKQPTQQLLRNLKQSQ
ncbi:unnamed protein product [Paramecium sonneborni]|uniref:Uncharacterized protein n=1 Tax=Paramecium sonneborni TaxID=65129 RepID=A0A8S1KE47_9CILI|nr:unnamed protein product [Paramecium sonneborni]CAD8052045.1 unnamed protein product [Paramecium sonneborni]